MNPMQIAGLGKIHLAQRRAINTFIKRYWEDQNRKIRQKIKGRNRGQEDIQTHVIYDGADFKFKKTCNLQRKEGRMSS